LGHGVMLFISPIQFQSTLMLDSLDLKWINILMKNMLIIFILVFLSGMYSKPFN
jgi:hypothetical protein